jgi:hypothetical protein
MQTDGILAFSAIRMQVLKVIINPSAERVYLILRIDWDSIVFTAGTYTKGYGLQGFQNAPKVS